MTTTRTLSPAAHRVLDGMASDWREATSRLLDIAAGDTDFRAGRRAVEIIRSKGFAVRNAEGSIVLTAAGLAYLQAEFA